MVCIYCRSKTQTINSRPKSRSNSTWRRRQCLSCKAIFTTDEHIDWAQSLVCKDQSGHLEPFSRDKLLISIHAALMHRNDAVEAANGLTDTIMAKLLATLDGAAVNKQAIIPIVEEVLRRFDKSAAVSYRAYHPVSK